MGFSGRRRRVGETRRHPGECTPHAARRRRKTKVERTVLLDQPSWQIPRDRVVPGRLYVKKWWPLRRNSKKVEIDISPCPTISYGLLQGTKTRENDKMFRCQASIAAGWFSPDGWAWIGPGDQPGMQKARMATGRNRLINHQERSAEASSKRDEFRIVGSCGEMMWSPRRPNKGNLALCFRTQPWRECRHLPKQYRHFRRMQAKNQPWVNSQQNRYRLNGAQMLAGYGLRSIADRSFHRKLILFLRPCLLETR